MPNPYDYSLDFSPIQMGLQSIQQAQQQKRQQGQEDRQYKLLEEQQLRDKAVQDRNLKFQEYQGSDDYSSEEALKMYPDKLEEIQLHGNYLTGLREAGGQDFSRRAFDAADRGDKESVFKILDANADFINNSGDQELSVDRLKMMYAEDPELFKDVAADVFVQSGGKRKDLKGKAQTLTPYQQADLSIKRENQKIKRIEAETKQQESKAKASKDEETRVIAAEKAARLTEEHEQLKRTKYVNQTKALDATTEAIDTIGRALSHSGLDSAVGSIIPYTRPGSEASDFEALFNSVQGINFTEVAASLGSISGLTEVEGKKLSDAVGALDLNSSPELMRSELARVYEKLLSERSKGFKRLSDRPEGEEGYVLRKTEMERNREEAALERKRKGA